MEQFTSKFLKKLLPLFFKQLYTRFAWAYDLVAWTTSMGQWKTWQSAAIEILPEGDLLEVGHGPGHLLLTLALGERKSIGVDSSIQMGRIAARRLKRNGYRPNVIRSVVQHLPLPSGHFSCVLSTFPSEYIYDPDTLSEVQRVLRPGGIFIIICTVYIIGRSIPDRFVAWLYRITGQTGEPGDNWSQPFDRVGFHSQLNYVQQERAVILRIVARKSQSQSGFAPSISQA